MNYRKALFETAEEIAAKRSGDLGQARANANSHLRYAALKLIEGRTDRVDIPNGEHLVAYGIDDAQREKWGDDVDWWDETHSVTGAHRIRVVGLERDTIHPHAAQVMNALGAEFVLHESGPGQIDSIHTGDVYHYIQRPSNEVTKEYREWLGSRTTGNRAPTAGEA